MATSHETPVPGTPERELRAARRRDEALASFCREIVASRNIAELLHLAARGACDGTDAEVSALWSVDGGKLRLDVSFGPVGSRERIALALSRLAESAISTGLIQHLPARAATAGDLGNDEALVVPIGAYGRIVGAIAVHGVPDRCADHETFLIRLADLVALAMDQAERCEVTRRLEAGLEELRRTVRRHEIAAETTEGATHRMEEARRALVAVSAFASRAEGAAADPDRLRECLEAIRRETQRVQRLLEERREGGAEPPGLAMLPVNTVLQQALNRVRETLVRRRVRLTKNFATDLPPLLLDQGRLQQAVDQVLAVALEAVAPGGRVRLESRRGTDHVVIEISHDGLRAPGDALDQLFAALDGAEPRTHGNGLGLARQIVRAHGGELRIRCQREWSSIATITLPVADNGDRRRTSAERRRTRRDRRASSARLDSTRG